MGTVVGMTGTFTEGMSFDYNGDNSYMDHIGADPPAFTIFNNQSPLYGTGIAFDAGDYKTVAASHEFGGLQDGATPSTKEELMAAYLEFLGITVSLQATFSSNVTLVCENSTVNFFDQSSGNVTSWEWIFEGGYPTTSSEQNPTVLYSATGSYNVVLTVSDGTENSTLTLNDYISVISSPNTPPAPSGPSTVCANEGNTPYSTTGLPGITEYTWVLEPSLSGNVIELGLSTIINWTNGFIGNATLKVAGENICGTGSYSDPINITRYLPEVLLEPFDWVCVGWPSFELTGGLPEGGVYSGPGVENGLFNPAVAGLGTHTITYTYTDPNSCDNFATETILVDPCTGINDMYGLSGIRIYPNPTKGMITVDFDQNIRIAEVLVVNLLNKVVFAESTETITEKNMNINLSNLAKGIYFIKLKTDKVEETVKVILQ